MAAYHLIVTCHVIAALMRSTEVYHQLLIRIVYGHAQCAR